MCMSLVLVASVMWMCFSVGEFGIHLPDKGFAVPCVDIAQWWRPSFSHSQPWRPRAGRGESGVLRS